MKAIPKMMVSLALLLFYQTVHADYVCKVTYSPIAVGTGSFGTVTVFRHDAPNCGGSFIGSSGFCTKNADYGPCVVSAYQYTERGILALYSSLVDALRDNTRITVTGNWCVNGGYGCPAYVNFHGD